MFVFLYLTKSRTLNKV